MYFPAVTLAWNSCIIYFKVEKINKNVLTLTPHTVIEILWTSPWKRHLNLPLPVFKNIFHIRPKFSLSPGQIIRTLLTLSHFNYFCFLFLYPFKYLINLYNAFRESKRLCGKHLNNANALWARKYLNVRMTAMPERDYRRTEGWRRKPFGRAGCAGAAVETLQRGPE